jgi:hypothetical protein
MSEEPVTVERLERGLAILAYIMALEEKERPEMVPKLVPLFERLERELAQLLRNEANTQRAKALLESIGRHHVLSIAPPKPPSE